MLALLCGVTNYTGKLIARCQDHPCSVDSKFGPTKKCNPLQTFEDIGESAFGDAGRYFITFVLYTELLGTCGLYFILAGDHLALLFPDYFSPAMFMAITAACILPTTWLADLSALSSIGLVGALSSIALTGVVVYTFLNGGVSDGFAETALVVPETLPLTFGLTSFVFAGHAVFPNIYASMEDKERFPEILDKSYAVVGTAVMLIGTAGYLMYGDQAAEEVTFNLPTGILATTATALIVVNPFAKFALTLSPVARGLERAAGFDIAGSGGKRAGALAARSGLVLGTLYFATSVPCFGIVMALIGSFTTLVVSVIFPSACYLKLYGDELEQSEIYLNYFVVLLGFVCAVSGTAAAVLSLASA
ncbi:hypothetical protein CYMTET_42209 [Cymbomonas tetramitiformis]|uniref:Amino acid transporter transmembrane domain-containing protein n=1 Tax=Cymbomonas tetramitiformis TaxID=36881 RepID=A0AAE0C4K6_9CHLO|nr:hypothetical protein CYMTET_42209 [Cymbomonas tetramitiformis]|eukprot:gene20631-24733_t